MRASATGMTDYEVNESGRMVIIACGQMFCAIDPSTTLHYSEVPDPSEAHVVNPPQPKICPINKDLIACVSKWSASGWKYDGISAGMPSYVVQEKFDRYVGLWWQPSNALAVVPGPGTDGQTLETHRYPKSGSANCVSDLLICQFRWTKNQVSRLQRIRLPRNPLRLVPGGFEYLVRAGMFSWHLYDHMASNFGPGVSPKSNESSVQKVHPFIRLLVEKGDQRWIEINDLFTFLSLPVQSIRNASADEQSTEMLTFIWASRRFGYTHLYLMERKWPKRVCARGKPEDVSLTSALDAEDVSTTQLTSGPWNVTGDKICVDEKANLCTSEQIMSIHYYGTYTLSFTPVTPLLSYS
ncbi:hypothetical protein AHF37_03006 [Paragonimus kellicotti]|nr:hypothetical protein AHF37_03006 [Paragonimus kellicotti]